ncbi:MAG: plasmid stabilization protein [Xanthobacteraceae bacterium]
MADLLIRNLDPELKRRLQARARAHNRSLSEEAQQLLKDVLRSPEAKRKLGTEMLNLIRPEDRGDDLVFKVPGELGPPPEFE